jgi:ATP-binding cassette, subfamily B, bacterial
MAEPGILTTLRRMTAAKMALVVSHRLAPARQADLIVAMDGRRVVAVGTHQELTRAGGPYIEMFSRQAESYVD